MAGFAKEIYRTTGETTMNFPDKFVIIEFTNNDDGYNNKFHKVFGSWAGGYTWGDSWKLNSGICSVTKKDARYELGGYSGSVYSVNPEMYGTTAYTHGILARFLEEEGIRALSHEEALEWLEKTCGN